MSKSRTEILEEMQGFMKPHAAPPEHWYVGTAAAARTQMFAVHRFTPKDVGMFRQTETESAASSLAALLIKRGAKGDASEKAGATSIYLFKMSSGTKPALGA